MRRDYTLPGNTYFSGLELHIVDPDGQHADVLHLLPGQRKISFIVIGRIFSGISPPPPPHPTLSLEAIGAFFWSKLIFKKGIFS